MKKIILVFTFILNLSCLAQQKIANLDFENVKNNFPEGWVVFGNGNGKVFSDGGERQEGKYAAVIESSEKGGFKALAYTLPDNYEGKTITFSGYIKTENVSDGFAGLWMRIDPDVGFENMKEHGIQGTTQWKKYEITLQLFPKQTDKIVFGALLSGKGKMWVDNLTVKIDGKNIEKARIFRKNIAQGDLDKEFDNGSKIQRIKLDTKSLKKLGLIWGYLKYYHPAVATGKYNWDYELLRIYPKLAEIPQNKQDEILVEWIKSLGKFEQEKNADDYKEVKIKPDLDWITSSGFSKELTEQLLMLKDAKRSKTNYYVNFFNGVNNPDFSNEKSYSKPICPDEGFRLLSLYRYWNIIQYYFPYKNLISEDWKSVLEEFIPKFIKADNELDYTLTSLELIGRIHDTHAGIWNRNAALVKFFGNRFTPVKLTFIENRAVVTDLYGNNTEKETGLEKGDVITKINGEEVDMIVKRMLKYMSASNYRTQLRDISEVLLRSNNQMIPVTISRNGKIEEMVIKTYPYADLNFKSGEKEFLTMQGKDIACLYMGSVKEEKLPEVFDHIKNTKGLIIDLRNYPSEFVVFKMGKLLNPASSDFVKFSNTSNIKPGLFTFRSGTKIPGSGSKAYKGKIAILINETTQSMAEYHAMAFRTAPNAKVFGSQTAGADGNVSQIILPGNISTMISGIGVYYPDGKETQRIGIVPDVEIEPTIDGIRNNKDEVLEKAVEWIKN